MGAIVKDPGQIRTPRGEDRIFETAVLQQVLAIYPRGAPWPSWSTRSPAKAAISPQRDAIERAVHSLAGCGLPRGCEELVLPSRAALRFEELLGE